MFTDEQLATLIKAQPIEKDLAFDAADDNSIRRFYEPLVGRWGRSHIITFSARCMEMGLVALSMKIWDIADDRVVL